MLCLDDTAKKAAFVAAQWKQAKGPQPDVVCGCGLKLPLRFAYRCLYCGEFYCQSCAEQHFGKTREQYNAEKVVAGDTPKTRGPWTGGSSKLAASGYSSQLAASGYSSKLAASGGSSIAVSSAIRCKAKVGKDGCIVLTRWVDYEKRYRVSVGYVGENIKADTLYELDDCGNFVEYQE